MVVQRIEPALEDAPFDRAAHVCIEEVEDDRTPALEQCARTRAVDSAGQCGPTRLPSLLQEPEQEIVVRPVPVGADRVPTLSIPLSRSTSPRRATSSTVPNRLSSLTKAGPSVWMCSTPDGVCRAPVMMSWIASSAMSKYSQGARSSVSPPGSASFGGGAIGQFTHLPSMNSGSRETVRLECIVPARQRRVGGAELAVTAAD